jgi:hypothetical protein
LGYAVRAKGVRKLLLVISIAECLVTKRFISLVTAAILFGAGAVLISPPAQADSPGCVTKHEYQRTTRGTDVRTAHRIYDTNGRFLDGGAGGYARRYGFCAKAQRQARANTFTVIYTWRSDGSVRSYSRYCGRTFEQGRSCF